MRKLLPWGALVLMAAAGCARPIPEAKEPTGPVQSGDILRPRFHFPEGFTAGRRTAFGVYVEVHRPGRSSPYDLLDHHVPEGSIRAIGTLTYFAADGSLADPLTLPFAHEC